MKIHWIPTYKIYFKEDKKIRKHYLNEITESVKKNGIIRPIYVMKTEIMEYIVINGHYRLLAARTVGLEEVPCNILTEEK